MCMVGDTSMNRIIGTRPFQLFKPLALVSIGVVETTEIVGRSSEAILLVLIYSGITE